LNTQAAKSEYLSFEMSLAVKFSPLHADTSFSVLHLQLKNKVKTFIYDAL